MARVTITDIQKMKLEKKKIVVMTAYDYSMASIIDRANVDILLVGDSGGRNLLGHEDNNSVTMDEMVLMTRSVSRGAKRALVIGDMPFMTYQVSKEKALRNAGRLIQEAGAQAVTLEVGADYAATVEAVVKAGIPVMAHMGLTPMATIGAASYRSGEINLEEENVWRDVDALVAAGELLAPPHWCSTRSGQAHNGKSQNSDHRWLWRGRQPRRSDRCYPRSRRFQCLGIG